MPLQPNETVGPYRIVEQIGAGGMAVVYRAHDDLLDRDVAVKLVSDTDSNRGRLRDEAAAHKQLTQDHPPHLVQLIDVVEDQRGLMLISEFVNGPSLEQVFSRHVGPMDEKVTRRLLRQIAIGLAVIHQRGYLHLDIKPANVLLERSQVAKLTDFGLTTHIGTQQIMDVGTVRYMAPELLRGQAADVRADLYSLGMIAYEMLAGRTKFDQAFAPVLRDRRNAAMRWVKWHSNPRTTAPPLSHLNPDISAPMTELVERLMAKDPQRRVASARELIGALDRLDSFGAQQRATGESESDSVSPESAAVTSGGGDSGGGGATAPLPQSGRTLRLVAIILISLALLAGAGFGLKVYLDHQAALRQIAQQTQQTLSAAEAAFTAGQFEQSEQLYQQVIERWSDNQDAVNAAQRGWHLAHGHNLLNGGQYEQAIEGFKQAADYGADTRELIDNARQRAAFVSAIEQIQSCITDGRFEEAQKLLRQWQQLTVSEAESSKLSALGERLADRRVVAGAEAVMARAQALVEQKRSRDAIALLAAEVDRYSTYRPLAEMYDSLVHQEAFDQAMAKATALKEAGDDAAALEAYREAAAIAPLPQLQKTIDELESDLLVSQGLTQLDEGRIDEAERSFILALGKNETNQRAHEALGRIASANRVQDFIQAGDAAMDAQDYDAAVRQYENAMRHGGGDSVSAKLRDARVRKLLTDAEAAPPDEAQKLLAQAREVDASHPLLEDATQRLSQRSEYLRLLAEGDAARDRSDFGEAKRAYGKAQKLMDTQQIQQRQDDVEYAQLLAQAASYIDQAQYAAAKAILRTLIQTRDTQQARDLLNEAIKQEPE
ncbi:MAG: protein kinase [Phycisphaeraceae bacterium]|nr:protein kinase [Phycisphaeraceae bacterium]